MQDPFPFSLITKLMNPMHSLVLRDWLEFLSIPPAEVVVYIRDTSEIRDCLRQLTDKFSIPLKMLPEEPEDDLKNLETPILERLVAASRGEFLFFCNLDTLPYREADRESDWLQDVLRTMQRHDLRFFTQAGVVHRADAVLEPGKYLRTQRFSNCCGLISREFWLAAMEEHPDTGTVDTARYHSEWAIEEVMRQKRLFGLRRLDSRQWRVFHVQQWDHRLLETRELFRDGRGIQRFLNPIMEECHHPWEMYFNFPRPPLLRLIRIHLGAWRRAVLARLGARCE